MAGRPLKPKHLRRNRVPPSRGEWVDLEPLARPVLPAALPKRPKGAGAWSPRSRALWKGIREDPVSAVYGPSELAVLREFMEMFEEYSRGRWSLVGPVQRGMDALGLTPRGKRDLRWRSPTEPKPEIPDAVGGDELGAARERRDRRVVAVDPAATG